MKKIFLTIIFLTIIITLQAQINKGRKLLSKNNYEAAIIAFQKDLKKPINKPVVLEELSKIYFNKKFNNYDIKQAYQYIGQAIKSYNSLDLTNRKKLQKNGVSKLKMTKFQSKIVSEAADIAKQSRKSENCNSFLEIYRTAPKHQVESMLKHRDMTAFREAMNIDNFKAYEAFYKLCEESCKKLNRELLIKAQKKLLESYIAEKGWPLYPAFEEKYKGNIYVKDAEIAYEFIKTVKKKSLRAYQKFTKAYPYSPFMKFAKDYMFDLIMEDTYLPDYDYFVRAYPWYEKKDKIWLKFYRLYLQEHGTESVNIFADSYPNYPFQDAIKADLKEAQNKKDKPVFEEIKRSKKILQILQFIEQSPSSPYIVQLEESMYLSLQKKPLFRGCKKFIELFPNSKYYDQVLVFLYEQYTKDGELSTIDNFKKDYPDFKDKERVMKDYKIAEKGWVLKLEATFNSKYTRDYENYIRTAAPKERAFVALQRLIEKDISEKNWPLAIAKIKKLAPYFGENNLKINNLLNVLSSKSLPVKKTNLGVGINSESHEYMPLITVDNRHLYFCRLDKTSTGGADENIYLTELKEGKWQAPEYLKSLNTHSNNEGPLAISADNRHLIIFKGNTGNGDMQISEHSNKGWSKPEPFPSTINTPSWDADAMISSDGKALLYVSERKEVLDLKTKGNLEGFHGSNTPNRDIFVSIKNEAGEWQKPINLGDIINTPFAERTPFLHPDMKTLYFSSDGHGGLGRLDVYKTSRLDDSWTNWSLPVNLGKSINTEKNDWGYRVSTDGKTVYFGATNKDLNEDIYHIELPEEFRPQTVSTISGHLTDRKGNPIEAEIIWEDMETGKEAGRLKSNHTTGRFFIALPNDKQYSYFVFKEHYFPKSNNIDLRNTQGRIELEEQLELIRIDEMIEHEISLPLKNLFFETNKYNIKSSSFLELNRLVDLVKKYELTIKIGGHTDNEGGNKFNLELSQNRADAVKAYLIEKGCPVKKIEAKGYGESKPVADNNTEEGKKHNRRVEVRFIKQTK